MEIQNKNILKKILPYLFVFIFSFVLAGNEYVKQISAPTEAADESVSVNIANVAAPLDETGEWKWNAIIFVDSYFKQPFNAEYSVHWCSSTENGTAEAEKTSCSPFSDPVEFRKTVKTESLVITSRQTTSQITHPGVSCGRVQVEVKRGEEILAKKLFDTGTSCSEFGLASRLSAEDSEIDSIRNMVLGFLGIFGKVDKVGNAQDTSGEDQQPEGEGRVPVPPISGNPVLPGPLLPRGPIKRTGDAQIDKAIDLYAHIQDICNGTVNASNVKTCLNSFPDQSVAALLTSDINAMIASYPGLKPLQCVVSSRSFMQAANGTTFPAIGDLTPRSLAENKKDFANLSWHPNDGFEKIQPNDLAVWTRPPHGHMAYVIIVEEPAGGSIKDVTFSVIESNTIFAGYISSSTHTLGGGVAGWFRLK